jgi:hypothetical protein
LRAASDRPETLIYAVYDGQSMKQSLVPDSSALVVVLDDRWVQDVDRDLRQAQAREVIASQIAGK